MEIERRLVDVLSEFARTVVTAFPIQAILDHLVVRIVDVLPIDGAGVTLIAPGSQPRYIAASDGAAMRYEELQTRYAEGPCLVAFETGAMVTVADLAGDERFPRFAEEAGAAGLAAVSTFPLRGADGELGALDLYRSTPGPLDAAAMAAAQTLADVATAYLVNARAHADLKAASERARQISLHDGLTGLPNRVLLEQRLDQVMARRRRSADRVGVLFADLDGFKLINDTHGHHVGDELLVAVADRLTGLLRAGDTLARIGGDEFVILCEDLTTPDELESLAQRIDRSIDRPFHLSIGAVHVTVSVGVALSRLRGEDPGRALRAADLAMYQAKREGGARHVTAAAPEMVRLS